MDKNCAEVIIGHLREAQKLGREAGEEQYQKLLKQGNRYAVINEGKEVGRMLDVCGIGMLTIPGNSPIVKAFKKIAKKEKDRSDLTINDGNGKMLIYKQDRGYGLILWLTNRQEMSVNEKAVDKVESYLESQGLECTARTVID